MAVLATAASLGVAYLIANQVVAVHHYRTAMAAAEKDDYTTALRHMSLAAKRDAQYVKWEHYLRAHQYMQQRKDALAVKEFEMVAGAFGDDSAFQINYRIARLNHAWESDDYVAYLALAEELLALKPDLPDSVMVNAAGNAYRYAQTGNEDFRRKSEAFLARLEQIDTANAFDANAARIRKCLETRAIPPH